MSSNLNNQRWIYLKRPINQVGFEHYELVDEVLDGSLSSDEVLLQNRYISVDPYMRIQQAASNSWELPHPLDTLQQSGVIAQVADSASSDFKPGDWVSAYTGWERYSKVHSAGLSKLDPAQAPVTTALGVLGMPGRTAWFGLMEAGKPRPGETVVVSGAAGAVGSLVVQFAKKSGCNVIAFAGSDEKCRWLQQDLNVDTAINYKNFSDHAQLHQHLNALGVRVDVYFDNVGGLISDAVIPLLNLRGRVVICGQMSQYNGQLDSVEMAPRFLHHLLYQRATIQGILARDYSHRMEEMIPTVAPWIADGSLVFEEAIVEDFEKLPMHLASLFDRTSRGKLLVKI